jgi:hypothetical protein
MTFASRLISHASGALHAGGSTRGALRGSWLAALGALALALALGGCEDKHIGRPCNTNVIDAGTTGSGNFVAIISEPDLACPERICLQAAPLGATGSSAASEGAMCTAGCSTDDDCSDSDPATSCKTGFVCAIPTTSGPYCCKKMCGCHDCIDVPPGGLQPPETCKSPSAGGPSPTTCENVAQ